MSVLADQTTLQLFSVYITKPAKMKLRLWCFIFIFCLFVGYFGVDKVNTVMFFSDFCLKVRSQSSSVRHKLVVSYCTETSTESWSLHFKPRVSVFLLAEIQKVEDELSPASPPEIELKQVGGSVGRTEASCDRTFTWSQQQFSAPRQSLKPQHLNRI